MGVWRERGLMLESAAALGPGTRRGMLLSTPFSHVSSYTRVSTRAHAGEDKTQTNTHEFGLL